MKIVEQALTKIRNKVRNQDYTIVLDKHNKILCQILSVLVKHKYLDKWEMQEYLTSKKEVRKRIVVHALPKLTNCYLVSPQITTKLKDIERIEKRFLPSVYIGHLILTTSKGLMTQEEVKNEYKIGGKIIAYVY